MLAPSPPAPLRAAPPPLAALRAFEAAARRLSFKQAGLEIGITPGAVSQHVKALEQRLGCVLFTRRNRGLSLTPSGNILLTDLADVFSRIERAMHRAAGIGLTPLVVSCAPTLAAKWLVPRLPGLADAAPGIEIRLRATDSMEDPRQSGVDVGLRYGAGPYVGVTAIPLFGEEPLIAVARPDLAVSWAEPGDRPPAMVLLREINPPGSPDWEDWLVATGCDRSRVRPGPLLSNGHMAIDAALAGQGATLAVAPLVAAELAAGRLRRLLGPALPNPSRHWILLAPGRETELKIKRFVAWLQAEAADPAAAA